MFVVIVITIKKGCFLFVVGLLLFEVDPENLRHLRSVTWFLAASSPGRELSEDAGRQYAVPETELHCKSRRQT